MRPEPLRLGAVELATPVVLAPMAGVTNVPFRQLCRAHVRESRAALGQTDVEASAALYTSEMVGARALLEDDHKTRRKASFAPDAPVRSIQLYGVEPGEIRDAVDLLVDADHVDHVDLNFGCPAPKVTRHGGGAALPWRLGRYERIVSAAVDAAGDVPVTVKLRTGIDEEHLTFLDAGRIAQDCGVAAVALHGRTASQKYSGLADRRRIAELVAALDVPVLGNGDIWTPEDALDMMRETGCAGVVIGRGCLGRPWLFRDLQFALAGESVPEPPDQGEVVDLLVRHATLMVDFFEEDKGMREMRKHVSWYLQGFPVGGERRRRLSMVSTLDEFETLLADLDREVPFDRAMRRQPRGHTGGNPKVPLPHGWLDSREDPVELADAAAVAVSGG